MTTHKQGVSIARKAGIFNTMEDKTAIGRVYFNYPSSVRGGIFSRNAIADILIFLIATVQ